MASFTAYHGVTANQHQASFNDLSSKGYRMIALSVYGPPNDARYAATWVKRPGNDYVAVHGVGNDAYQKFFNDSTAKGFAPVLISATGNNNNAIFAAVFEKGIAGGWKARHGMGSAHAPNNPSFDEENASALTQKLMLKQVTIYGDANDKRYAAIWHANPGYVKWHVHADDPAASYQATFNAETQLNPYRPAHVVSSEHQVYCSLFKDDIVGGWVATHGITSDAYQAAFNTQSAKGLMPICIDGSGSGNNTRYSAIFAPTDIPQPRAFTITGTGNSKLNGLDNIIKSFMQTNWIRCMQLCVGKNGSIKYNKAFTWAEKDYRITQPSDRFCLASCSKMFVEAAMQLIFDTPAYNIKPTKKAYSLLGYSNPKSAQSDNITIQQLLDHTSGIDPSFDPTYKMRDVAIALGVNAIISKDQICKYMYQNKSLNQTPGSAVYAYSNYGYLLLTRLVEKITGQDYFQFLKSKILTPENITEVKVWQTVAVPRPGDEVLHEDQWLSVGATNASSNVLIPAVYGGDGMLKEIAVGSCGLASSAHAMTQFIHHHAVWGNGPRNPGATRTGGTPGVGTLAQSRNDGIDWSYAINTRDYATDAKTASDKLNADIKAVLDAAAGL